MYTRVVEATAKKGKSQELANHINDKVVPTLRKQSGFMDEIVLVSDAERDRVLAISFWKTRDEAERYHRAEFQRIEESLRHLLETGPNIRTFEVHTSTGHKIAAGKAA